ncbi:MAG: hypothetical protein KKF48_02940 [Nanoarchaeota archaeon]|nr:hypothetical protein [Nanoarchaeota archaeon]MBU1027979.1 hypothetical protein [Nanoarchaeota archaeon]
MINKNDFEENLKRFDELENRGSYYPMFLNMIEKGFETEAFLFILSTWNFATFRYAMKDFDLKEFKQVVKNLKPYFKKFDGKSIREIDLDFYKKEIKHIFDTLSKIKGIQYTGASKLMHLTIPEVFIMWDAYIRKAWGFKTGDSEDYFNFLKKMRQEFKDFSHKEERTLAKCIDEYNYVKYTLPALENQRKKKNGANKS